MKVWRRECGEICLVIPAIFGEAPHDPGGGMALGTQRRIAPKEWPGGVRRPPCRPRGRPAAVAG